jgi:hypothetical protein
LTLSTESGLYHENTQKTL